MKFSVLIPAYKSLYLKEAIQSVLAQTFRDFELVIVDDHSPEDLTSIVSGFDDPRIVFSRNEVNCGAVNVVDNWNRCLERSNGDYVICIGDDDRLLPGSLQALSDLSGKYPGLGVYHLQTQIIDGNGDLLRDLPARPEFESASDAAAGRFTGREQFIGDFCFEAARLKSEGGFYKLPLAWGSDDISFFRAAAYAGVANTREVCFQYRETGCTLTSSANRWIKLKTYGPYSRWLDGFIASDRSLARKKRRYLFRMIMHEIKCLLLHQ